MRSRRRYNSCDRYGLCLHRHDGIPRSPCWTGKPRKRRLYLLGGHLPEGDARAALSNRGLDVYGARCAILHAFGSEVNFHQQNPDAKIFGYHDGGKHALDTQVSERLVIIGTASFLNDVVLAVEAFLKACETDLYLRARAEGRLPKVLANFPIAAE